MTNTIDDTLLKTITERIENAGADTEEFDIPGIVYTVMSHDKSTDDGSVIDNHVMFWMIVEDHAK